MRKSVNVDIPLLYILTTIDLPVSSNAAPRSTYTAPPGPLELNTTASSDGVAIGHAAGSLDPIQGPGDDQRQRADTLTVNDQGTTIARTFTLDAGTHFLGQR